MSTDSWSSTITGSDRGHLRERHRPRDRRLLRRGLTDARRPETVARIDRTTSPTTAGQIAISAIAVHSVTLSGDARNASASGGTYGIASWKAATPRHAIARKPFAGSSAVGGRASGCVGSHELTEHEGAEGDPPGVIGVSAEADDRPTRQPR